MWIDWFDRALDAETTPAYMPDMVAPRFPESARHLVAMASHAWVFGGMGSWNDVSFSDGAVSAEHAEISRLLFAALTTSVVAAVNCPLS